MSNFKPEDRDRLIDSGMLAICGDTRREFSVGPVEVVQRYLDCSVFICPECGHTHDDRTQWGSDPDARMGYRVVTKRGALDDWWWAR